MKIKKVLITILLAIFIIISFNYSLAAPLTEPSKTDETPILYRINLYIGAAVTVIQIVLFITFFVVLIKNSIKLSKANKEYNRLQNEEIDNKEEEIRKVETRIKDAKKRIVGLIVIVLILFSISKLKEFLLIPKPLKPDNY